MSNYFLLTKGDFAYNKSYSSEYPWGAIKRLDHYEYGALSSLYICFRPLSHVSSDFLVHYFETKKWHQGVSEIAVEGARNHGLLNIGIQDFFATNHYLPQELSEQKKIAEFLNLIEKRISVQSRIIEKYETLIKGIVEKILVSTQSIPLHHYSPIITSGKDKNNEGNYPLYGSTGIIGTVSNPSYNKTVVLVARVGSVGNVQYVTEPCGISDNTLIIDAGEDNRFMYYFLKNYKFIHITSGTTQPLITASSLKKIEVPMIDKQERNKIVTILNAIEYKLNNEKMIASLLYRQKNFLLSQMFI